MECAPYVTKKKKLREKLRDTAQANENRWCESPFCEAIFFSSLLYVFIYCSVFDPFPIMICNENRDEKKNQCQCFYLSAFYCCSYPVLCIYAAYTIDMPIYLLILLLTAFVSFPSIWRYRYIYRRTFENDSSSINRWIKSI